MNPIKNSYEIENYIILRFYILGACLYPTYNTEHISMFSVQLGTQIHL